MGVLGKGGIEFQEPNGSVTPLMLSKGPMMFALNCTTKCLLALSLSAMFSLSLLAQPDSSRATNLSPRGDTLHLPVGASDTTTLSFKDTDLRDIFRALSLQHSVNVFLDNATAKKVTVSLNRVRVYDAITFLARENGLEVQFDGGIFRILPPPPAPPPPEPPPKVPGYCSKTGSFRSISRTMILRKSFS